MAQSRTRTAIAKSLLFVIARSRRRRGNLKEFAKGNQTVPGPGMSCSV
jgi:hypothetical protein